MIVSHCDKKYHQHRTTPYHERYLHRLQCYHCGTRFLVEPSVLHSQVCPGCAGLLHIVGRWDLAYEGWLTPNQEVGHGAFSVIQWSR